MKFFFAVFSLMTLFIAQPTFAQEDSGMFHTFSVGLTGGVGFVKHTAAFALAMPVMPDSTKSLAPASSLSFFAGVNLEYTLPNGSTSLSLKAFYNNQTTTSAGISGRSYDVVNNDGQLVTTTVEHRIDFISSYFNTEILVQQNIFDQFSLGAGAGVGIPLDGKVEQGFHLLSPADAEFEKDPNAESKGLRYSEDNRSIFLENNDVLKTQFYVKVGARYKIFLGDFIITPFAFYNVGLTQATRDESFKMNVVQLGADFNFGL